MTYSLLLVQQFMGIGLHILNQLFALGGDGESRTTEFGFELTIDGIVPVFSFGVL